MDIEKVRNGKESVIKKGKTEIPFEFIIPYNTLSSYSGKNAWITYSVKATIDKKMRIDVNSSINFEVISLSMTIIVILIDLFQFHHPIEMILN